MRQAQAPEFWTLRSVYKIRVGKDKEIQGLCEWEDIMIQITWVSQIVFFQAENIYIFLISVSSWQECSTLWDAQFYKVTLLFCFLLLIYPVSFNLHRVFLVIFLLLFREMWFSMRMQNTQMKNAAILIMFGIKRNVQLIRIYVFFWSRQSRWWFDFHFKSTFQSFKVIYSSKIQEPPPPNNEQVLILLDAFFK